MSNEHNTFKAGLFMVISVALVVAIIIGIKGAGNFFQVNRDLIGRFELTTNIGGLKVGDPVRLGGWQQGRVTNIRFIDATKSDPAHLLVDFNIPNKYDIRKDAQLVMEQGLTGTTNLNITSLGHGDGLKEGDTLPGQPAWLSLFADIAPKATIVLDTANTTMKRADEALTNARDLLGDTKSDFRNTIANLSGVTGTMKERLPSSFDKIDQFLTTTTSTINGAKGTLEDIRASAANTRDVTENIRSILTRNRSRIDTMLQNLRVTSANLEGASAEVRRSPWRLLYKPSADEMGNLNLYDTARQFAEAASSLNDASSAVRDATKDPTIKPEQLETMLKTLDESFKKYQQVETKLWDSVK